MNYYSYLSLIEENINNLVSVQESFNEIYNCLDKDSVEDISRLRTLLQDEKDILSGLINNLNGLFNIKPKWYKKGFSIKPMELKLYEIKPPYFLPTSSMEFMLLKKLLIRLHEKHLLSDGFICYTYSSTESHMWEIPNNIPDDAFVNKLRKQIR